MAGSIRVGIDRHHLLDALDHILMLHAQSIEGLGGQAVVFLDQGQKYMFGAHIGLMERTGLVLRDHQHLPGLIGEFIE